MKKIITTVVFIIFIALTGCSSQDNQAVIEKNENKYSLSVPLNLKVMKKYYELDVERERKSQFANLELLDEAKTRIELEISASDNGKSATVNGTYFFKEGSYSFTSKGRFNQFISPDTGSVYYFVDVEGDKGFALLTVFSEEDNRAYIENTYPVKLGEHKYHAIFGEKFVNKDYWKAAMGN